MARATRLTLWTTLATAFLAVLTSRWPRRVLRMIMLPLARFVSRSVATPVARRARVSHAPAHAVDHPTPPHEPVRPPSPAHPKPPEQRHGSWWQTIKRAFSNWSAHKVPRMGAALAYYTVFSLAPVLLLVITVTGLVVGDQPVRGELGRQLQDLLGPDTTRAIMDMMARAQQTSSGTIATVVSAVMLILGATGVFGELQDGLNTIFGVQAKPGRSMRVLIRDRLLSFGMILGIAFLLMVSLALSAVISALGKYAGGILGNRETFFRIANIVVSLALYTFLFAAIFKVLPDAKVRWRDAAIGALLTSVLFTIGRVLIGLYLGASSMASSFGAAGSLATILVWTYYSAQILYLGAELTRAYAELRGQQIVPNANAQWVPCAQEA